MFLLLTAKNKKSKR